MVAMGGYFLDASRNIGSVCRCANSDANTYSDTDTDTDPHADSDAYTNSDSNSDAYTRAIGNRTA